MSLKPRTIPTKTLIQNLSSTGSTLYPSDTLDWDGSQLAPSSFGTQLFAVLHNSTNTQIEIIELDPSTVSIASALSILKRALGYDGTQVAGTETAYDWNAFDTLIELGADVPQLLKDYASQTGTNIFSGTNTFLQSPTVPTPINPTDAVTKAYADALTASGAPDASVTAKGIGKSSYAPDKILGTVTVTIASPAVATLTAHGLVAGDSIKFTTTGALPTGIVAGNTYYVVSAGFTTNTFEFSVTPGGSAVNTTAAQSGTHTLTRLTPVFIGQQDPRIQNTSSGSPIDGVTNKIVDSNDSAHLLPTFGGTGADGALNVTSGTTTLNLGQLYNYTTINVSAGATLAFVGSGPVLIRGTGAATIAGTIELRGLVGTAFVKQLTRDYIQSGSAYPTVVVPNGEGGTAVGNGGAGGSSTVAGIGTGGAVGSPGAGGLTSSTGGGGGGAGTTNAGATATTDAGGAGGSAGADGDGGSGGGGRNSGNGGAGGNGGGGTSGNGRSGGNGGNSGSAGGVGGQGGNGGTAAIGGGIGNHGVGGIGGAGGKGYTTGGLGGNGGTSVSYNSADPGSAGGAGGDAITGNGGAGGVGGAGNSTNSNTSAGIGGAGGKSRYSTGGAGGQGGSGVDVTGGQGGRGGDGITGGQGGQGGNAQTSGGGPHTGGQGGRGGDGRAGSAPMIMYIAGTLSFTGIINAQGGDGGNGGNGGTGSGSGGSGGVGGRGGDSGNGADIIMVSLGALTYSGTVNNLGGTVGTGGSGGAGSSGATGATGASGTKGRDGIAVVSQLQTF